MKKTISLVLALLMLVSLFAALPLTANAEDEAKVTLTSKQGFFDDYTKSYKKGDTFYVQINLQSQKLLYHNEVYFRFDHNKLRCTDLEFMNGEDGALFNIDEGYQEETDGVLALASNSERYNYKEKKTYIVAQFELLDASSPVSIEFDVSLLTIIMDENDKSLYDIAIDESVVDIDYSDYYDYSIEDSDSDNSSGTTGDCTWEYSPAYATMTISGNGNMPNYTKPSERPWNSFLNDIKHIVIENGVKNIGAYAFKDAQIKNIIIPDSVTEIGETAFFGCSSLREVTLGNGLKTIGEYAFADTALESVSIPSNVESLGQYSFGYKNDEVRYIYVPVSDFAISGYENSAAETYADKNGFIFSALNEETTEPDTTPETPECVVAGNETDIFKSLWDAGEKSNLMTIRSDGKYEKTYTVDKAYDGVQLKVFCNGHWCGNKYGNNIYIDLTEAGSFTVVFDPETKEITLEGSIVQPHKIVINDMYAIGAGGGNFLNNISWDFDESNIMTEIKPGVYEITYEKVEAYFDYNFKFAANGKWDDNWGAENDNTIEVNVETKALFNKNNIYFDVPDDDSKVTLRLDLTGFNAETSEGAKFTVIINDEEIETLPDEPKETTSPADNPTEPKETTEPVEDKPTEPKETTKPAEDKPTEPKETTESAEDKPTEPKETTKPAEDKPTELPTESKDTTTPNEETTESSETTKATDTTATQAVTQSTTATTYKPTVKPASKPKPNTLKVSVKKKTVKAKKLKKKSQKIKPLTVKNAVGKLSFKIKKAPKKLKKLVKINKKGVITIKKWKKAKKGNYKIKVTITAAGNKAYLPLTLTKTVTVKIK